MNSIKIPRAIYRLQFTPDFHFRNALEILPYLQDLGISHIYASPVTKPRSGSLHGYDVCDPRMLNPELGTNDEFLELLLEVKWRDMGWIQDIVPNHMAFSHENPFIVDVLESGQKSRYADFFDINWYHTRENLRGKLLVPFLGKHYYECLSDGELEIAYENGGLWVAYFDHRFPLAPESYQMVLGDVQDKYPKFPEHQSEGYKILFDILYSFENFAKVNPVSERDTIVTLLKSRLEKLILSDPEIKAHLTSRLNLFRTGTQVTNVRFDRLMSQQNFKLALWNTTAEELNYRRFFAVNDLISLRTELEPVFEETHAFLLNFIQKGLISGLRIDHIDGLYNPEAYLKTLRSYAPRTYIVVEKILGRTEKLPQSWPVQGTSGYEFMNVLNNLFCNLEAEKQFTHLYEKFTDRLVSPEDLEVSNKRLVIDTMMSGDIDNLTNLILKMTDIEASGKDISFAALRQALVEVMSHFPVYRTYFSRNSFPNEDHQQIVSAINLSRIDNPDLAFELNFLEHFLNLNRNTLHASPIYVHWLNAVMKFQQYTGALMAKGIEDTMFYVYNRHIALNEVGGWPSQFGLSLKEFHEIMIERSLQSPHSMNATSTHDTKRGEDARARLQVLTEIPEEWADKVTLWSEMNQQFKTLHYNAIYPDPNEEYFYYQALTGSFPIDGKINHEFIQRMKDYMTKAIREAKVNTTWESPNTPYEEALMIFIENTLDEIKNPSFVTDFRSFAERVSWFGMLNSFSQTILKMTLSGIPDFYRGAEYWDLSFVDPDNRRPADFSLLRTLFESFHDHDIDLRQLSVKLQDGRLKMYLIKCCLDLRKRLTSLFESGDYIPLTVKGSRSNHIIAFQRNHLGKSIIVITPRFFSRLGSLNGPFHEMDWEDTSIEIPITQNGSDWTNIFTGKRLIINNKIAISDIFDNIPFAVYYSGE